VAEKDWGLPARHHEEDGSQRTEPPKGHDGTIGSAVDPCDRIFLHNPLHDYESVWWIAVWFVFHCEPKGVADAVMEEARNYAFHDRTVTFLTSGGEQAWKRLPEVLQPLGKVLVKMKRILADAYRSFEDDFDGSGMLLVFPKLREHLQLLAEHAQGLAVTPLVLRHRWNVEEVRLFDAVEEQEQQRQQTMEQMAGTGGQPTDADNLLLQVEGNALGKRTRDDSPPKIDRASRREKFNDGPSADL
jgi:hypothetical protein